MENLDSGVVNKVCTLASLLGTPGMIVAVLASPITGNIHDPNIYLGAAVNVLFYAFVFHRIETRRRNKH